MDALRGVVATREVELQPEGVVKHAFNLDNVEKWLAEGMGMVWGVAKMVWVWLLSLTTGEYRRLDLLQLDLMAILKQASKEGDRGVACEIGRSFLSARDRVCGDGRGQMWSPALTYTSQ